MPEYYKQIEIFKKKMGIFILYGEKSECGTIAIIWYSWCLCFSVFPGCLGVTAEAGRSAGCLFCSAGYPSKGRWEVAFSRPSFPISGDFLLSMMLECPRHSVGI